MDNVTLFKWAKHRLNLKQSTLAAELGLSKPTVAGYECGQRPIPDKVFKSLLALVAAKEQRVENRQRFIDETAAKLRR